MAKIWKCKYDDRYEIFTEENVDHYEDGTGGPFEIFRAEDDDRIVGIGFWLCDITRKNDTQ